MGVVEAAQKVVHAHPAEEYSKIYLDAFVWAWYKLFFFPEDLVIAATVSFLVVGGRNADFTWWPIFRF
jgi:membrane-anchored protein YejM (alkaline phosphatase superfamily)